MLFFFSSRRRHTRYIGDWSSDVCSSDLTSCHRRYQVALYRHQESPCPEKSPRPPRSEERRVGKECRSGWLRFPYKKEVNSVAVSLSAAAMPRTVLCAQRPVRNI